MIAEVGRCVGRPSGHCDDVRLVVVVSLSEAGCAGADKGGESGRAVAHGRRT